MNKAHGLCLLIFAAVFLTPASVFACQAQSARPAISISLTEKPVAFDISRTISELNGMDLSTPSPYPSSYHVDVGGVMSGEVAVEHSITFRREEQDGKKCVNVKQVNVKITTTPTIFIANDYQDKQCWFKEIFRHESKHVEIDRAIMKKYEGRFTDGINMMLMGPADYSSGWVEASAAEHVQNDMRVGIEQGLGYLFDQMMIERNERQLALDSLEEYTAISQACQSPSS